MLEHCNYNSKLLRGYASAGDDWAAKRVARVDRHHGGSHWLVENDFWDWLDTAIAMGVDLLDRRKVEEFRGYRASRGPNCGTFGPR